MVIFVRKSASVGKHAGLWSVGFKVPAVAENPQAKLLKAGEKNIAEKNDKELYAATFTAASGDTGTAFEYIIIAKADYESGTFDKIDWATAKWSKYNASKGIKLGAKSKYAVVDRNEGKAEAHELADGDYILVRRAGVKKTNCCLYYF